MTHPSDPAELSVLARIAGAQDDDALRDVVGDLALDEAAVGRATHTGEAHVERFRLAARLTAHVRHRAKYRDVPLAADLRDVENRHRGGEVLDIRTALVDAIALRYDVT
jgi:hypothetical protein